MARPRKLQEDLRIYQVNIRLTETEKLKADEQAEMAGLSVANWLRTAAFSKKTLQVKVSPMHRTYYRQLVGIGSNVNQLARKINQNQYPKIYQQLLDVKSLLIKINEIFQE
ncbi:plasmid mobilization protein [Marinifilum caeruleilacunae]|uniref:Plasmid mobilization relaxosome protein MobC n=1 Tax=Marinifilum caeruleilacunae TaxID=2499076 RepID=A0ABX1WXC3_9BACT|nr:plasmid mobilization relaxosome protein MobC [Marinifilum caeruleilacunae]NOU60571.1 plasmid mobilization relaxosome protein MobC [Marinifilum caeruleilacunae]